MDMYILYNKVGFECFADKGAVMRKEKRGRCSMSTKKELQKMALFQYNSLDRQTDRQTDR